MDETVAPGAPVKHVVRPEDNYLPGGRWVRTWSIIALHPSGAVEVAQQIRTRAEARRTAAILSCVPVGWVR